MSGQKLVSQIQELREATGAGVMECKKALEEAAGNLGRAKEIIRERGMAKMEKRADRATGAGFIQPYIHNSRIGVLVDVRAETDFVVRSEPFQQLAKEIAMHIAAANPANIEELLAQPYVRDESMTVETIIKDASAKVGEVIRVNAFSRLEV